MNKAEVQESLVTLYLRLNGYFTSGFIVHSPIHGRNRTEVDVLAVRFPFNAEPARGLGSDDELGTSNNSVEFIIGEVKSRGQQLSLTLMNYAAERFLYRLSRSKPWSTSGSRTVA